MNTNTGTKYPDITVELSDGKAIERLENRATVLDRQYEDTGRMVTMRVRIGRRRLFRLCDDRRIEPAAGRVEERPVRLLCGIREPAVKAVEQKA